MSGTEISVVLYVAGDGPNSRLARAQLESRREALDANPDVCVEVVDVFDAPQRALDDGVFLTPVLKVSAGNFQRTVIGNLSDEAVVDEALSICRPEAS